MLFSVCFLLDISSALAPFEFELFDVVDCCCLLLFLHSSRYECPCLIAFWYANPSAFSIAGWCTFRQPLWGPAQLFLGVLLLFLV